MPENEGGGHTGTVPFPTVTGYVLAGGQSRRMGRDKAFLRFGGEELIGIAVDRLSTLCSTVRILSGPASFERDAVLDCYAPVISDRVSRCGPLAGVDAALADAATEWLLITAVDQVFVSAAVLVPWLQAGLATSHLFSFFSLAGRPQPLPLLLRRSLQPNVQRCLQRGDRKLLQSLQALTDEVGGSVLTFPLPDTPEARQAFINLNTPEDMEEAEQLVNAPETPNQIGSRASE